MGLHFLFSFFLFDMSFALRRGGMWEQERDGGTSSHSQENKGDGWVGDKKEGKKSKMRKENRKNR